MNIFVDGITNAKVKELMVQFFEEADKLYIDMDKLSYNEFKIREHNMWEFRHKASEIEGDYFLISLNGLERKASELYGDKYKNDMIDLISGEMHL